MSSLRHTSTRRSIALLCIVAVLIAPLMPGVSAMDWAISEPSWVLLLPLAAVIDVRPVEHAAIASAAVLTRLSGRAPPAPRFPV